MLWLTGALIRVVASLVPSHLFRRMEQENAIKVTIGSSNMAGPMEALPTFDGNKVKWMSLQAVDSGNSLTLVSCADTVVLSFSTNIGRFSESSEFMKLVERNLS